jgi:histidinol-phosphatase (PHP family)
MTDKGNEARALADGMIAGIKSGFFQVVAHPDQIFRRKDIWDEECEQIANEIKTCATDKGIILEKNVCNKIGKKKRRGYRLEFWRNLSDKVQTIYGMDAHSVVELEENYLIWMKDEVEG